MGEAEVPEEYAVIGRRDVDGQQVVLKCSRQRPGRYLLQYANTVDYFKSLADAMLYMHSKWGLDIIGKTPAAWQDGPKRPR